MLLEIIGLSISAALAGGCMGVLFGMTIAEKKSPVLRFVKC